MKWFLPLLFILLSCNVNQLITGAKTDIPDDFYDSKGDGPQDTYVFMSCNGTPCFFNSRDESITTMDSSGTLSTPVEYYPYKGYIFFQAWSGATNTYRYEIATNNLTLIEANAGKGFKEYAGELYYLSDVGQLRVLTSPTSSSIDLLAITYATSYWLHPDYGDYGTGKFFFCRDNAGNQLYELSIAYDGGGNPTSATENPVVPTNVGTEFCNTDRPYGKNGHLLSTDGASLIYHYDIINNYEYNFNQGTTNNSVWFDEDGTFYYADTGALDLYAFNVYNDTSGRIILPGTFSPSNLLKIINSPEGNVYYINKDGNGDDQLFEMDSSLAVTQLTNLDNTNTVLYFEIGSKGFYFFRFDGVWRMDFNGTLSHVYSGTISNADFRSYSHDRVNNYQ